MAREVVVDAEFNSLHNPTIVWCIICKDLQTNKVSKFEHGSIKHRRFISYLQSYDKIIGHNFLEYDLVHLNNLIPNLHLNPLKVFDTLITSRFLHYNIPGGHSLKEWGNRLGIPKLHADETQEFFNVYSQELVDRCVSDVDVTTKLYSFLNKYITEENKKALDIEHKTCLICQDLHNTGFYFDISKARELHKEIKSKLDEINKNIATAFPPRAKMIREIMPKATKSGAISLVDFRWLPEPRDMSTFEIGSPFCRISWHDFNPGSHKQIVERLNEYGWQPTDKTKGHIDFAREKSSFKFGGGRNKRSAQSKQRSIRNGDTSGETDRTEYFREFGWKVNETNLNTLPPSAPKEAHLLKDWILLDSRRSTLEEWFNAYRSDTGRIHGKYNHIGAWTHRFSHAVPNMANIPRASNPYYGRSFRKLWCVPKGELLVGTDASSIQLRVLAHHISDPEFTKQVISGYIHQTNKEVLGEVCADSSKAKTFIYAWILGAQGPKVGDIFSCSSDEGYECIYKFENRWPMIVEFKKRQMPTDAARGYFISIDGRKIACSSAHKMLSGYLQAGEAIIMKHACLDWRTRLKSKGIWFKQVNFVHDEWQTQTLDNKELASYIGANQVQSIREVGERLKLNCPLDGEYKIGYNWYETH